MLTEEQLKTRLTGIGGDDAAAIVGKHPFRTAYEVAMRLSEGYTPPDIGDKDIILFGNEMEPVLARIYAKRNGVEVYEEEGLTHRHPKYPFLIGHIDRRIKGDPTRAIECKNVGAFVHERWGKPGTDEVPERVLVQVHHYMMVVPEIVVFDVVNCVGGNRYNQYTVVRNDALIDALLQMELKFHADLKAGKLPEPDWAHNTTGELLKRLNNQIEGSIEAMPQLDSWTKDYFEVHTEAERLRKLAEGIKLQIEHKIGNAGIAMLSDGTKWQRKRIKKSAYTVEATEYIECRHVKPRKKGEKNEPASEE